MSDEAPDHPAEPVAGALAPPPSLHGLGVKVVAGLALVNVLGMGWLAVRSDSDPSTQKVLDGMAQFGLGASAAFVAYRILVRYPFRILDLLTIVMVLGSGIKVIIDALTSFSQYSLIWEGRLQDADKFGPLMLSVLLACSVLMGGAALGLRYCVRLKLDRPLARIWAVISGMLALPGLAGCLVFALTFISAATDADAFVPATAGPSRLARSSQLADLMGVSVLFWLISLVISISNTVYFLKALSNEEVAGNQQGTENPKSQEPSSKQTTNR